MPLKEERGYFARFERHSRHPFWPKPKFFSSTIRTIPSRPSRPKHFWKKSVAFAKKHQLIVAYDNAYSEMYYEEPPLSFLEIPGAKDVGIEFHSLSKTLQHDRVAHRLGSG